MCSTDVFLLINTEDIPHAHNCFYGRQITVTSLNNLGEIVSLLIIQVHHWYAEIEELGIADY